MKNTLMPCYLMLLTCFAEICFKDDAKEKSTPKSPNMTGKKAQEYVPDPTIEFPHTKDPTRRRIGLRRRTRPLGT